MGVHSQFYGTLVSTTLSIISPIIYWVCFAYLLFQRYGKRDNTAADLVTVEKRLKNRVTWALAFMATWQVMTIVIACTYSLLSYNLAYHGGQASNSCGNHMLQALEFGWKCHTSGCFQCRDS
uniref:G-protein coupled receptors family 1 profile domain-containing protein n=1 Tax=Romanomermis culicivorax TaxID=13658 RepID=A0A915IJV8_ROMCU